MIPERNRAPVAIDGRMPHIENAQENIPPCADRGTLAGGEAANHYKRHPLDNLYKTSTALVDEPDSEPTASLVSQA